MGPTFQNSPAWKHSSADVRRSDGSETSPFAIRGIRKMATVSTSNRAKNSIVHDCSFDVGDDAICIKSGKDKEGRNRKMPTEKPYCEKLCRFFMGTVV